MANRNWWDNRWDLSTSLRPPEGVRKIGAAHQMLPSLEEAIKLARESLASTGDGECALRQLYEARRSRRSDTSGA